MASPPGSATRARLHLPTRGPNTHTDARNCRTAAKSASYLSSSGEVMVTVDPSRSTVAPNPRRTSAINGTYAQTVGLNPEKDGLITTYWGAEEDGGARRKYYSITAAGREYHERKSREWRELNVILNKLIGGDEA